VVAQADRRLAVRFRYLVSAYSDKADEKQIGTTSVYDSSHEAIKEAKRLASIYPGAFVFVQVEMVFA
jgi:hypothetical protein